MAAPGRFQRGDEKRVGCPAGFADLPSASLLTSLGKRRAAGE